MKTITVVFILMIFRSSLIAQTDSDLAGNWKCFVKASLKGDTKPTYMVLNSDGTFIQGIDSTADDPIKNSSRGKWILTGEKEIKLIPDDTSAEIRYYVPKENFLYEYRYTEKEGKKIMIIMTDMDFYIEKIFDRE